MGSLPTHPINQLLRNRNQTVSQYVFIRDFIILKSEIVAVQFHFKPTFFMVVDPLEMTLPKEKEVSTTPEETKILSGLINAGSKQLRNKPVRGELTIVFVLKDGISPRVIAGGLVALLGLGLLIGYGLRESTAPQNQPQIEKQKFG